MTWPHSSEQHALPKDHAGLARADWTTRSVLVTGGAGVVGSQLVHRLLDLGATVTCFVRDHDPATFLWSSGDVEKVSVASGRLECFDHVKAAVVEREIDTVFHLGAQALVGAARLDPIGTFESNIRGTYHLLDACRVCAARVKRVVIASSDKAYGECEALPYTEDTPLSAKNPYDVSKCCSDMLAQSYAASYGLPIAIARCGNIFGPGDLNWSRLVPGTMRSALQGRRPVIRSDGTFVRDYLFVEDAVDGYIAMCDWLDRTASASDPQRAFNFSTGQPLTVLEMTSLILAACGRQDLQPIVLNQAHGEIPAQHLDSNRARRLLCWQPRWTIPDALDATVKWYRHKVAGCTLAAPQLHLAGHTVSRASA